MYDANGRPSGGVMRFDNGGPGVFVWLLLVRGLKPRFWSLQQLVWFKALILVLAAAFYTLCSVPVQWFMGMQDSCPVKKKACLFMPPPIWMQKMSCSCTRQVQSNKNSVLITLHTQMVQVLQAWKQRRSCSCSRHALSVAI